MPIVAGDERAGLGMGRIAVRLEGKHTQGRVEGIQVPGGIQHTQFSHDTLVVRADIAAR